MLRAFVWVALLPHPVALAAQRPNHPLTLATTTSIRDSRLLEHLLPEFQHQSGIRVRVIAVGSGQALELGRRGEADLLIVHDPAGEARFLAQGYGVERVPLMYNEFVLVGPTGDPAGVRARGILGALRRIASEAVESETIRFVSRADRSGTHTKERALWNLARVNPGRSWYRESGQGMSATLQIANELQAYALTDLGTFLGHRYPLDLDVLVQGDSGLFNLYHVLLPNPARFSWLNVQGARALRDYLASPETRERIRAFGLEEHGRSLFVPLLPGTPEG